MARNKAKRKSAKPKGKTIPSRSQQQRSRQAPRSWAEEAAQEKFSLVDEARWASNHRSKAFDADAKLRYMQPIAFVSAGNLEGTIKKIETPPSTPSESSSPTAPAAHIMARMKLQSRSPSPSSSSEDEVVFRGRDSTPFSQVTAPSTAPTVMSKPTPTLTNKTLPEPADEYNEDEIQERTLASGDTVPQLTRSSSANERVSFPVRPAASVSVKATVRVEEQMTVKAQDESDGEEVIGDVFKSRLRGQSPWMTGTTPWASKSKPGVGWLPSHERPDLGSFLRGAVDTRAAAMEDYMQNIEDFGIGENSTFQPRNLDLSEGEDIPQESESSPKELDAIRLAEGWDSDNLRDLDGFSTSSDVMDNIERIVATRSRKSGVQYLVVYEGSTPDDVHWLPASFLRSDEERELIRAFEATRSEHDDYSDSDEFDDEDEEDDVEIDLTDEQMARLLQKQEELGLGSEEVMLYGGKEFFGGQAIDDSAFYRPFNKRQDRTREKRAQHSFPSASAMADALDADPYNGFDVMDTERPSLRPTKRGRRGQQPPELSDEELNATLHASWEADRSKKRLKKAEREELRKQGLLGRKGKAPALNVKYKDGFDLNQIIEEIRDFMFSETQTLSLPPMEAHQRAVIHQVVHQLNVTSKSRGQGVDRFTVLSKTSRTKRVDDDFFDALFQKRGVRARFAMTKGGPKRGKKTATRPVVSYKDGDTVGASAPEIGADSYGHRLMMKMGWSKGQSLGAEGSSGILQPIAHTVKTTKAGLK